MHTITTVLPPGLIESDFNNLWKSQPNAPSETIKYQYWGIYLFGGFKEDEDQMNDLWLIRPHFKNKVESIPVKRKRQMTACYSIEAVKIEPDGKPPIARALHTTVFVKNRYLIIYGGKSKDIYTSTKTISLNDICIYDIISNKWDAIVTYGFHPNSRWSHCMTVYDQDKIIVFGGANLNNYCDISLSVLTITNNVFKSKEDLKEKNKKKSKLLKDFIKRIERLYGEIKPHLK